MLLNEEQTENTHICYFDSSNVLACKYKRDTSQLAVIFGRGNQYIYENVTPYTFQRFKVAKSQGIALNRFIKDKFKYSKAGEKLDLTEVLETIKRLKENK